MYHSSTQMQPIMPFFSSCITCPYCAHQILQQISTDEEQLTKGKDSLHAPNSLLRGWEQIDTKYGTLQEFIDTFISIHKSYNNVLDNKAYSLIAKTHFRSFPAMI